MITKELGLVGSDMFSTIALVGIIVVPVLSALFYTYLYPKDESGHRHWHNPFS